MIKILYSILLAISFVALVGVIAPAIKDISDIKKSIEVYKKRIDVNDRYIKKIEDLIEKRDSYSTKLQRVEKIIPDNPEISAILSFLEETARINEMRIEDLATFQKIRGRDEDIFKVINFSFILQGEYEGFKNFLEEVEKSERLIEVRRISIEETQTNDLFTIRAIAYYYKEQ